MIIIKPGVIPKPKIYKFTCGNCECIFECSQLECIKCKDFNFSWYMIHECPTCHRICESKHY